MDNNKKSEKANYIMHFTNIYCLKHILEKGFVFSDPSKWEDRNDTELIKIYESYCTSKVYVLCFCNGKETIHHWSYYGTRKKQELNSAEYKLEGIKCCIYFDSKKLIEFFQSLDRKIYLYRERVQYLSITDFEHKNMTIEDLLFTKRTFYKVDEEMRLVYIKDASDTQLPPQINLNKFIHHVSIDGRISSDEFVDISQKLFNDFNILRCANIIHSHLYRSDRWIAAANEIAERNKRHL